MTKRSIRGESSPRTARLYPACRAVSDMRRHIQNIVAADGRDWLDTACRFREANAESRKSPHPFSILGGWSAKCEAGESIEAGMVFDIASGAGHTRHKGGHEAVGGNESKVVILSTDADPGVPVR